MLNLKNCANDIVRPRCPRYSVSDRSESIAMRKKMSNFTNDTLHIKCSEFYLCFHNSFVNLTFSRVPVRNSF